MVFRELIAIKEAQPKSLLLIKRILQFIIQNLLTR